MENLTKYLKVLTNEVSKLERRSIEEITRNKFSKSPFFKKNNNSQLAKSSYSSNSLFNDESRGMENYYTFHRKKHLERTFPQ